MKTSLKNALSILIMASTTLAVMAQNQPTGLMTDLIEHTERTWHNGYSTTVPVWQTSSAIEPLQYAEISSTHPRFSWIVPGTTQGTMQTAWHIIVSDNLEDALNGKGNLWNSQWRESGESVAVGYEGCPLQARSNYFWRVRTRTNTGGESQWSEVKAFRTASMLTDEGTAHYPLVKSLEKATYIRQTAGGTCFIDFGKDAFGQLLLTLTSTGDNDSITIRLGECLRDGQIDHDPGGSRRFREYHIGLMRGLHTYRIKNQKDDRNTGEKAVHLPAYIGEVFPFRYAEVEGYGRDISQDMVSREAVHYPFDETAGKFHCSNDTLNQIWELCKYSMKATSFAGIFVDGDRERIPYEADALINQLSYYSVAREYSLPRRTYLYLLNRPTWPTEWILQAIFIAWYDYLYTGDERALRVTYQQLKPRLLDALREGNGLISTTKGKQTEEFLKSIYMEEPIKDIVDWPRTDTFNGEIKFGESDGFVFTDFNAVTNAYRYAALLYMAKVARAIGEESTTYEDEAQKLKDIYHKAFFDKKNHRYTDGLTAETTHASLHANMFPLAFGLTPTKEVKHVGDFILSRGMACSVYGVQFLLDALYESRHADYALHLMTKDDDRSWYNMLRVGSTITLEAWDNKYKPNQDWNHAWGAAPGNIITRKLMGVEPLEPGFKTIRIRPQVSTLNEASITIPTIRGEICADIKQPTHDTFIMNITIPANMEAEIFLPVINEKQTITLDGKNLRIKPQKGESHVYAGKIQGGEYSYTIKKTI